MVDLDLDLDFPLAAALAFLAILKRIRIPVVDCRVSRRVVARNLAHSPDKSNGTEAYFMWIGWFVFFFNSVMEYLGRNTPLILKKVKSSQIL